MVPLLRMIRASALAGSLTLLAAMLAAMPAAATASLTCGAEDRNVSFDLLGNIGSGDGAAIQVTAGEIKLKAMRGKFDTREFKIEPEHVAGRWNFGNELRLGFSPETVGEVTVFLAIIAERVKSKNADLDHYRGSYVLKVNGPKGETVLKGRLKGCSAG